MIELRAFGSTSLKGPEGNELLSVLSRPKLLSLLVLLGAWPGEGYVRRETLTGLLWTDVDPERARANLRQFIYKLRGSLGADSIEVRGEDEIRLNPSVVWCDVRRFHEALSRNEREEALVLYRGDLMEGFFPAKAPEFERWLELRRGELKRVSAEVAWALAEEMAGIGNEAGAGHWSRRSIELCGCDESLFRQSMELLDQLGDAGGALETFQTLEERLNAHDLSPSEDTRDMVTRIREGRRESEMTDLLPAREPRFDPGHDQAPPSTDGGPVSSPRKRFWRRTKKGWPVPISTLLFLTLPLAGVFLALGWPKLEGPTPSFETGVIDGDLSLGVLAILPFETTGSDEEAQELAVGLHQGLFSQLSRIPGLTLISDRTMAGYQGTRVSPPRIGRELGAGGVLQGNITWAGTEVRMTVRLMDAGREELIWEESYEGSIRNLLEALTDIALNVGQELGALTQTDEIMPFPPPASLSMDAYRPYLRSRALAGTEASLADLMVEERLLLQALSIDPTFADAWSALGWNYARRAEDHGQAGPLADSALVAAQNAFSHDAESAEAHLVMGWVFVQRGYLTQGKESLDRALELNQNLAIGYLLRGKTLLSLGRFDEAIRDLEKALVRDPRGTGPRSFTGFAYSFLGDMERAEWWVSREIERIDPGSAERLYLEAVRLSWKKDAEGAYEKGIEMVEASPERARLRLYLADLALQSGRWGPASLQAERAMAMSSEPEDLRYIFSGQTLRGFALQKCGETQASDFFLQKSRERLLSHVGRGSEDPFLFAELAAVYEALGDRETALVWVRKARQDGLRPLRLLRDHPLFESLRTDPGFQEVLEDIGRELQLMRRGMQEAGDSVFREEAIQLAPAH